MFALCLAEGSVLALQAALLGLAGAIAQTPAMNHAAASTLLHVAVPLRLAWPALAIVGAGFLVLMAAVALATARALRLSAREALAHE